MRYLMVWQKTDGTIYCKIVKHQYDYHKPGYINRYGHSLLYSTNLNDFMYKKKLSLRKRLLTRKVKKLQRKLEKLK